jgi:thiamine biosynthesis lipoprotein
MQQISFRSMNCQMLACLDDDAPRAARRLTEVPGWFEDWEQRLSRFRPDSELSRINQRAANSVTVSGVMSDVLRAARLSVRESGGLVNPLVLPALEAAGYDRSFEQMVAEGGVANANPKGLVSVQNLYPVAETFRISHSGRLELPPGSRLDLGGVAKGWAADRAAQRLGKLAPALVDAGGDIAVSGPQAGGSPWPVGVSDPFDPARTLDVVALSRGGVATSGRDYRRWQRGNAMQHHIIDPRTGSPAITDVLTATVIGPSARAAETAAKTALILGSWHGLDWLEKRPHLAGLLVLEDGLVLGTQNWASYTFGRFPKFSETSEILSSGESYEYNSLIPTR